MNELDNDLEELMLKVKEIEERKNLLLKNQASDIDNKTTAESDNDEGDEFFSNPQTPSSELSRSLSLLSSSTATTTTTTKKSSIPSTSSTPSPDSSLTSSYAAPCPNPFMVSSIEISQDQFYDRLSLRISTKIMEFHLNKEVQDFFKFRTLFLLDFTEEEIFLENADFISCFRASFSSVITAGVLVQRTVRPKGTKGKTEDSPIRVRFLQLIYILWNILDFDVKGYGNSLPNHQQLVTGWEPLNIRLAFAKHVDNFLFNGVKTIKSSSETFDLSLEKVIYQVIRNRCEDGRRNFKNRVLKRQRALEEIVGINIESISAEAVAKGICFRNKTCKLGTSSVNVLWAENGCLSNFGVASDDHGGAEVEASQQDLTMQEKLMPQNRSTLKAQGRFQPFQDQAH